MFQRFLQSIRTARQQLRSSRAEAIRSTGIKQVSAKPITRAQKPIQQLSPEELQAKIHALRQSLVKAEIQHREEMLQASRTQLADMQGSVAAAPSAEGETTELLWMTYAR